MPREISLYYFLLVYKILRDNGHLYLIVFLTVQAICIQKQTQLHLPQVFQIKVAQLRSALTLGQKTNIIQHSEKTSKATQEGEKSSAKFVFFLPFYSNQEHFVSHVQIYAINNKRGRRFLGQTSIRHETGVQDSSCNIAVTSTTQALYKTFIEFISLFIYIHRLKKLNT